MIRQTSIEAFKQIESEGLLSRLRLRVYQYVFKHGPCTASQVHAGLAKGISDGSGSFTARLSELRDQGVIKEVGFTHCPFTGRRVILWDVTDGLPIKLLKPKRTKCKYCNGRGYHEEQQTRFNLK